MRIFFRLLKIVVLFALFLALLGFAFENFEIVVVRYFPGFEWEVPLALVLFLFFGGGAVIGLMGGFAIIVSQRREIVSLKRELRSQMRVVTAPGAATAESL